MKTQRIISTPKTTQATPTSMPASAPASMIDFAVASITAFAPVNDFSGYEAKIDNFYHGIGYEIACRDERFIVNVNGRRCTCKRKEKVEQYVASCYKKEVFEACYNCVLFPLAGDKF
ncbi:hypothetical protein PTKIN_Ptkin03bG0204400 [Pterospermum kingtungense]